MLDTQAPPYSVHPSVAYVQAILSHLKSKTGRDLDGWVAFVQGEGPTSERERRAWLKEQGLGSNQAWFVAERSVGTSAHAFDDTPEGYLSNAARYVDQQYAGKKAALRPLAERVLDLCRALGPDVRVCPCETIIPIYRTHVFAQLKPFATRLDLGLALGDPGQLKKVPNRLIDTGGFSKKDRLTHKLELRSEAELDEPLTRWLRQAYETD